MKETYEKDLEKAMAEFVKEIKKYAIEGRDFRYFSPYLRMTARDGGKNIAAVAKAYLAGSCRVHLACSNTMLNTNWDGNLETVSQPIEDGVQYLLQIYLI